MILQVQVELCNSYSLLYMSCVGKVNTWNRYHCDLQAYSVPQSILVDAQTLRVLSSLISGILFFLQ